VLKHFSITPPENSGGPEKSTENSGSHAKNFFCSMYEMSPRHPVWVAEILVKVYLCTHRFFPRILRIRKDSLGLYGKEFDEISIYANILYSYSSYIAKNLYGRSSYPPKFFMHILNILQNLLCKYRDKICGKFFVPFKFPRKFFGTQTLRFCHGNIHNQKLMLHISCAMSR
jgi:hypothetical protein